MRLFRRSTLPIVLILSQKSQDYLSLLTQTKILTTKLLLPFITYITAITCTITQEADKDISLIAVDK